MTFLKQVNLFFGCKLTVFAIILVGIRFPIAISINFIIVNFAILSFTVIYVSSKILNI